MAKEQFMVVVDGEGAWVEGKVKAYNCGMVASLTATETVGVWKNGELQWFFRDGEEVAIADEFEQDFDDDFDDGYAEVGYDPYTGCGGWDC